MTPEQRGALRAILRWAGKWRVRGMGPEPLQTLEDPTESVRRFEAARDLLLPLLADAAEWPCVSRASGSCVYLRDGTKVILRREGDRAWLEHVVQDAVTLAAVAAEGEPR